MGHSGTHTAHESQSPLGLEDLLFPWAAGPRRKQFVSAAKIL
jgi:hypothetical protein